MMIRKWADDDVDELVPLMFQYLDEMHKAGSKIMATTHNVKHFLDIGFTGAAKGEPCLVADLEGIHGTIPMLVELKIIGFCIFVSLPGLLDTDGRILQGLGTYVSPEHRGKQVAHQLREHAFELAQHLGYQRIEGVSMSVHGTLTALATGSKCAGTLIVKDFREG